MPRNGELHLSDDAKKFAFIVTKKGKSRWPQAFCKSDITTWLRKRFKSVITANLAHGVYDDQMVNLMGPLCHGVAASRAVPPPGHELC